MSCTGKTGDALKKCKAAEKVKTAAAFKAANTRLTLTKIKKAKEERDKNRKTVTTPPPNKERPATTIPLGLRTLNNKTKIKRSRRTKKRK